MNVQLHEIMLTDNYKVELQKRKIEVSSPYAVGVRNTYSLISPGTELALYTGTHIGFTDPEIKWAEYPLRPGYASVGRVEFVGDQTAGFHVGDTVLHFQPHADYSVVDTQNALILRLSQDINPKHALFARFGQIAYTAVAASRKSDGPVLLYGGGIVGNLCAQIFMQRKNRPAILADISVSRLKLAESCGIDSRINPAEEDVKKALFAASHGSGVSTVVEATGVPELVTSALDYVNPQGEVILLGSTRGKVELDVYKLVHRKSTMLIGAHESRYPLFDKRGQENSHHFFCNDVLSMIAGQVLRVDPFITDIVAPENVENAYQMLMHEKDQHIGILINWE